MAGVVTRDIGHSARRPPSAKTTSNSPRQPRVAQMLVPACPQVSPPAREHRRAEEAVRGSWSAPGQKTIVAARYVLAHLDHPGGPGAAAQREAVDLLQLFVQHVGDAAPGGAVAGRR